MKEISETEPRCPPSLWFGPVMSGFPMSTCGATHQQLSAVFPTVVSLYLSSFILTTFTHYHSQNSSNEAETGSLPEMH